MGKNFKNIDDLYRSELGGGVTEAPDFVKANIDNALGFKKRKRGFLLLGLVALVTGAGLSLFYFGGDEEKQYAQWALEESRSNALHKNFAVESPEEITNSETNNPDETTLSASDASNNQNTFNNTNSTSLAIVRNMNSGNSSETASPEVDNNGSFGTARLDESNQNSSQATGTDTENGVTTVENNTNTSNTETQSIPSDLGANENDQADANENNNSDSHNENQIESTDNPNEEGTGENEHNLATSETVNEEDKTANVNNDTDTEADTNENETPEQDSLTDIADDENTIIGPPPTDNYKPWMVSLTSGLNLTRSSYQSTDMDQKVLYDNANSDRFGNQTNLDFTYRLKNGLAFGTGLGLVNFEEDYSFVTTKTESNTIVNVEPVWEYEYEYDLYYTSPVDTFDVVDSTFFVTDSTGFIVDTVETYQFESSTSETVHEGRNKASYLNIPIHFGAQMQFNKFQIDLYASARFNFLLRSSGGYQLGNAFIPFGGSNSIYKPFYVDLMLASKVHYNFWKNLYVTGTVQYRPVIGSAYKDLPFSKTFDYVHFGVGLSMRF